MDESYQRFLEEMTNEVVRLDLSTDKALKNVFRKHIKHNIGKLDEVGCDIVVIYNNKNCVIFLIKKKKTKNCCKYFILIEGDEIGKLLYKNKAILFSTYLYTYISLENGTSNYIVFHK